MPRRENLHYSFSEKCISGAMAHFRIIHNRRTKAASFRPHMWIVVMALWFLVGIVVVLYI